MGFKESVNGFVNDHPTLVLVRRAFKEWSDDESPTMSAALAFYAILAIAPLIVIAIAVAGLVYGQAAASGELSRTLGSVMGDQAAQTIESMVAAANARGGQGAVAGVIGFIVLLLAASNVFAQLHKFMNKAWDVREAAVGFMDKIKDRLIAIGAVVVVGVLVIASIIATTALSAFGGAITGAIPGGALLWQAVQFLVTVGLVTLLFAVLFKYLPDARVSWDDTWTGALITGVLFAIGQLALSVYLTRSATVNAYGAAGSVIAFLLWAYYSSMIFFFGVELTQVYANTRGDRIRPEQGARARERELPSDRNRPSEPGAGA